MIIIIRGIPGSGKSYFAKRVEEKLGSNILDIVSADHYWYDSDGNYNFDGSKLWLAHKKCQDKFLKSLQKQTPFIIVDNTNIQLQNFHFYLKHAQQHNQTVMLCHVQYNISPNHCAIVNQHNVPIASIVKMNNNYEPAQADILVNSATEKSVLDLIAYS